MFNTRFINIRPNWVYRMNKQNMIYLYTGMLLIIKNEWTFDSHNKIDISQVLSEWQHKDDIMYKFIYMKF